jgi:hypothetical protein
MSELRLGLLDDDSALPQAARSVGGSRLES